MIEQPDPTLMEAIFRLRGHAWKSRIPAFPAPARWEDPEDEDCLHWAILHTGQVVAAARLSLVRRLQDAPNAEVYEGVLPELTGMVASINRLVVDPAHGKRGLSQWLDRVRLARADAAGASHVVAQTFTGLPRIATLRALGFRIAGEARAYQSGPLLQMNALMARPDPSTQPGLSTTVLIRSRADL